MLEYCEHVSHKGLNLVYGPGNDLCAITALMAAGAQIVLFTTGRGTPFGCPVPTMKIATQNDIASRKPGWIDFSAGPLLEGAAMADEAEALFSLVLSVASGETQPRSEKLSKRNLAIFKDGVTL